MPTIEEHLDGVIAWVQRGLESDCVWCHGKGVRTAHDYEPCECPTCHGKGYYDLAGAAKRTCGLCGGTGQWKTLVDQEVPCDACEGGGRIHYGPFDAEVQQGVLPGVIGAMLAHREKEDFEGMHRVLDWAARYCAQVMAEQLSQLKDNPGLADDLKRRFAQAGNLEAKEHFRFSAEPISPEELAKLIAEHEAEQAAGE